MSSAEKFIDGYEQTVTEISARIAAEIKEAGPNTPLGGKFNWLLHAINGAFSNAYTLIQLMRMDIDRLELRASQATPVGDRIMLEKLLAEHREREAGTAKQGRSAEVTEADEALAEAIIRAGWLSPNTVIESRLSGQ
jgi:hypothetical protein